MSVLLVSSINSWTYRYESIRNSRKLEQTKKLAFQKSQTRYLLGGSNRLWTYFLENTMIKPLSLHEL